MNRLKELRMSLIIIVIGVFFLSGCFFNSKNMVTFKTNGGSSVSPITVKSGNKIEEPDTPVKDGYVFDGWYLDGEEYDFSKGVDEDITLVAKWRKIEITDGSGDIALEETTTTVSTKKTTTKKTTTTKNSSSTTKTTKKTTKTTKKVSSSSSNSSSVSSASSNIGNGTSTTTAHTTTTTTTTSTSAGILPTTNAPITTTSTTVATTTVARLKIEKTTEADATETIKVSYGVSDEDSNVITNINPVTLEKLINANRAAYKIMDNNGNEYKNENNVYTENLLTLKGFTNVTSLAFTYIDKDTNQESNLPVLIEYNNGKWYVNDVTVMVHLDKSLNNIRYYSNLKDALVHAEDDETVDILKDITISEMLEINNYLTINGNGHKLTSTSDIMFVVPATFDHNKRSIEFENFEVNCKTIIKVETDNIKHVIFNKLSGNATVSIFEPSEKKDSILVNNDSNINYPLGV